MNDYTKVLDTKHHRRDTKVTLMRFSSSIIIDEKDVYHFGASLKDLGKKWFAFSKFEKKALDMLRKLK